MSNMNSDMLAGLASIVAAAERLPIIEGELKDKIDDNDLLELELAEKADKIRELELKISNLENAAEIKQGELDAANRRVVELSERNRELDTSINELLNKSREMLIDNDALTQRVRILSTDKDELTARLADAKSFSARLADKVRDISALVSSAKPEATNTAPFPVSNAMELPVSSGDANGGNVLTFNPDPVEIAPVAPVVENTEGELIEDQSSGCFAYRYW